jgi:sarcosine oxidase
VTAIRRWPVFERISRVIAGPFQEVRQLHNTFDVIVVGVGAMGSAACYHLAKRGVRVLGLEQFSIPNAMGSSHGESRMIRLCYYEHPDYVPLLRRAYELWHELQAHAKCQLLLMTGGIYMGHPQGEFIAGTLRSAARFNLPHESLTRHELRRRFPQFNVPDHYAAVHEPNAGLLLPERVIAAHAQLAISHGASLRAHEPVVDWASTSHGVSVRTTNGAYAANHLIICGGAWSAKVLGEIGVNLLVTRQVLGWVWPRKPELFALGQLPVWAIDHPDATLHYGFPMLPADLSARPGFKIAHHFRGEATSAEAVNRLPQQNDEEDFRWALARYIPDADGPLLSMAVCMYTNTPDSHFIIDRLGGAGCAHDNVTVACGFSGHGFKFSSVIGEILADLATQGATLHPIQFLRLDRFAGAASPQRR